MDFYLTAPDGSRIHFPVNPERITCQTGNRIEAFDVISLGTVSLPRGTVPARFTLEGFFPGEARKDSAFVTDWRPPKELVEVLSRWRDEGNKLRFLVTETPINHDVYFDGEGSFEHEWRGGHGDCYFTIRLVQARDLLILAEGEVSSSSAAILQQGTTVKTAPSRPVPPAPKTYTVKPGDTLWAIAKKTLGDGSKWQTIYANNKSTIGSDPNKIKTGQVLRIA